MSATTRLMLAVTLVTLPVGAAIADGLETDYGAPGPYEGQPSYQSPEGDPNYQPGQPGQPGDPNYQAGQPTGMYQAPPEGTCYDDQNQPYDCSTDQEYAQYSQMDDGYDTSAYQQFQDVLSPYGSWVETAEYGRVWTPSTAVVGYDFSPYYSGGRWSLTDYGWTWVSDWDWGWAPFHYGRWLSLPGHGWSWIPGRVWGPAWVHWRHGGGHVGWTPLPPRGIRISAPVGPRAGHWNFVPVAQLGGRQMVRVPPSYVGGIYARTSGMNVYRSIGAARVNIGPPVHTLGLGHLQPVPLRSYQASMPRSSIEVRVGAPLQARPYYGGGYRGSVGGWRGGGSGVPVIRPSGPVGGPRPFVGAPQPQPGWQRPGGTPGWQQPSGSPPVWQRPSGSPGWQGTHVPSPTPAPPVYRPSMPSPTPTPGWQRPTPAPMPSPGWQRPSPTPMPTPSPSPGWQRPSPAPMPAPVYRPAPTPMPAPVYRPAPAPMPHYVPAPAPAPRFNSPSPHFNSPAPHFNSPSPAPHYNAPPRGHR